MKKLFVSMMVIAMSLSTFAAKTITLTLKGENGGTYYQTSVVLTEDAARNDSYESGYDAERVSVEPSGVLGVMLYGFVGTKKCEYIYSNNLDNIALGFTSNVTDVTYHLLINVDASFTANEYRLYDSVKDQYIALDGSVTDYVFTAAAGRVTVDNRFVVKTPAPVYSVTTNIDGWASYSSDVDLVAPTGLTVYAGTIDDEELSLTSVGYIKANEGVIVKGEAGLTYTLTPGSGSDSYTNDLKPSSAWASHSGTIYCLHNEGVGTTAFYQYTGSDMPANKAYLQISTTSSAPKRISMRFNQPTAIENVELEAVKAEKFIENGQVLIKRGEIIYNVQGQIVK